MEVGGAGVNPSSHRVKQGRTMDSSSVHNS